MRRCECLPRVKCACARAPLRGMIRCRWLLVHSLLLAAVGVVFYSEYATYHAAYDRWPRLEEVSSDRAVSILLVADPQIVGEQDEPSWPVGSVFRWDCDRYLRRTFEAALAHTQPDAVVFLGDLIDEGEKATDAEWARYVRRFSSIFHPHDGQFASVFLPGDNDVGGEGVNPVMPDRVKRFRDAFPVWPGTRKPIVRNRGRVFMLVRDPFGGTMDEEGDVNAQGNDQLLSVFRIVATHLPFVTHPEDEHCDVKVGAHTHISSVTWSRRKETPDSKTKHQATSDALASVVKDPDETTVFRFDTERILPRIIVPTCSYRMGMKEMGYGHLRVLLNAEQSGEGKVVEYRVLWLPGRFRQLALDAAAACILLLYACLVPKTGRYFHARRWKRNAPSSASRD
ncbi:unnamed protein product [Notodromas monacha]|uniref:Calcineurin-like phosphoesterase domain-containing protein n=1 Tax=Notodromas monacha TaxID=399045 RepID=A0A7R9BGB1_9CRUS|nr:unnamed protein product [Notodromas monacha]CAG0914219.1 unnamed protein product [Notodromas monacha]